MSNDIIGLASELQLQAKVCQQEADDHRQLQRELDVLTLGSDPDKLVARAKVHLVSALRLTANCLASQVRWALDRNEEYETLDSAAKEHEAVIDQIRTLEIETASRVLEQHGVLPPYTNNPLEGKSTDDAKRQRSSTPRVPRPSRRNGAVDPQTARW